MSTFNGTRFGGAMAKVMRERIRQELLKHEGRFTYTCADEFPSEDKLAVLLEEVGEVAREVLILKGIVQEQLIGNALRKELIQVAAVAVAWIESLDG